MLASNSQYTQIAKLMGPIWGPPGSCRPQMGPMLAPWTLLSGYLILPIRSALPNRSTAIQNCHTFLFISSGYDIFPFLAIFSDKSWLILLQRLTIFCHLEIYKPLSLLWMEWWFLLTSFTAKWQFLITSPKCTWIWSQYIDVKDHYHY